MRGNLLQGRKALFIPGIRSQAEAIECVQRALAEDICRKEGYRILMRFYALTGRREQALRQSELCGQMLREELGLESAEKTLRLAEEIQEGLLV